MVVKEKGKRRRYLAHAIERNADGEEVGIPYELIKNSGRTGLGFRSSQIIQRRGKITIAGPEPYQCLYVSEFIESVLQ